MENKTILVIEDNDLNRKLFCAMLEMGHYKPLAAEDAETGLEILREVRPDLILMDIQLPGMDGLSATRLIKKDPDLQAIPVVALTAYAMPEDEQTALDAGCSGYISKPVDTRTFLDKLVSFLEETKAEDKNEVPFDHKKKILIVDDDPSNIKLLRAKLSTGHYEINSAINGEDALEKAGANPPDLILLDIMMPGIDGLEVTKRLKNSPETNDIPVILITALGEENYKEKGLEAGADDFLNKPINTVEIQARVRSLLRLKEYKDQLKVHGQCEKMLVSPSDLQRDKKPAEDAPSLLLVEDDEKDAKLLLESLVELPCRILWVREGAEALQRVQEEVIDVVILDLLLPDVDGFEVCRRLKKRQETANIQILIVTSLQDLDSKIKGIELGADEYLVKPVNRYELNVRVSALMKKKAYLDKLTRNYENAFSSAITDRLTGLYNRSYFDHFIDIELKRSSRQRSPLALVMIDIDDFKQYNDEFGHLEGDRILKDIGVKIKASIRETDFGARYGGEEFVIVLPGTDQGAALKVSERIKEAVRDCVPENRGHETTNGLTVSIGIAAFPSDGDSPKALIEAADRALYSAKGAGKDRICVGD